jgi:molecular chaperone GrpE
MTSEKDPTAASTASDEQPAAAETAVAEKAEEKAVDIQALQRELEEQKKLAKHNLDQWKRTAADLENYRKRTEKERGELIKFGAAGLIKTLLPVLDDFERALQTCPDPCYQLTWTEGVALIDRKLRLVLEQQGLREIEALGKPFDPAMHEALLEEKTSAHPDGHVSAVLQKGYMLHDRVLRPAMVKIARNESGATKETAEKSASTADAQAKGESEITDK